MATAEYLRREHLAPDELMIAARADVADSVRHAVKRFVARTTREVTFYEFFCGGGMARAGLGPEWTCLFANDIDPRKAAAYAANWGATLLWSATSPPLTAGDLPGVADLAWASFPLPGPVTRWRSRGPRRRALRLVLAVRETHAGASRRGRAPRMIVLGERHRLADVTWRQGLRRDLRRLADADYRFGAVVIDAALFVPQSRERVFIVGVDADAHIPAELVADGPMAPFHPPTLVAACQRQLHSDLVAPSDPAGAKFDLGRRPRGRTVRRPWNTQAETDRMLGMMAPTMSPRSKQRNAQASGLSVASTDASAIGRKRSSRGSSLRRRRRVPPGSDRRIQSSDDRDR